MNDQTFKFSDATIAGIAKLVQMAILTGTDVVDNLRLMELKVSEGMLVPTEDFLKRIEDNIGNMLAFAEENSTDE